MKVLAYMIFNLETNETIFLDSTKNRISEDDYCKLLGKYKVANCRCRNYRNLSITKVYRC